MGQIYEAMHPKGQEPYPIWERFKLNERSTLTLPWRVLQTAPEELRERFVAVIHELLPETRPT